MKDWESEFSIATEQGETEHAAAALEKTRERMQSFLAGDREAFRAAPKKRVRVAAARLAGALDNAMEIGIGQGLGKFNLGVPEEGRDDPDPWTWNRLMLAGDQGPDNVACIHALLYSPAWRINLVPFWDFSHGVWNDWRAALKQIGRWPWLLLSIVCFNAPHGPWCENRFYMDIKNAASEMMAGLLVTGFDCPLLGHYWVDLIADMNLEGRIGDPELPTLVMQDT